MASSPQSRSKLVLCALLTSEGLTRALEQEQADLAANGDNRFILTQFQQQSDFLQFLHQKHALIDCLIFEHDRSLPQLFQELQARSIAIPTVVLTPQSLTNFEAIASPDLAEEPMDDSQNSRLQSPSTLYQAVALQVDVKKLCPIGAWVEAAIAKFLNLSDTSFLSCDLISNSLTALTVQRSLMQQQQRLAEKLKERLGYLGVYYKRNPAHFLRHMNEPEQQELLQQLAIDYRHIILNYFSNEIDLNQTIDNFVDLIFFADVPVAQIVEIHMDLMDEFSKQLKLEGRGEEILLDYRLTLIDTLAHLCEMYRRSIPRES
jgi:circadian clock protein KaiA